MNKSHSQQFASLLIFMVLAAPAALSQGLGKGEVTLGGSPYNTSLKITSSGTGVESVNLQTGRTHVTIPLLHLKGVGFDTVINYEYNSPDQASSEKLFYKAGSQYSWVGEPFGSKYPSGRVGFAKSGDIDWYDAQVICMSEDGQDFSADGWDDGGDDACDEDGTACAPCEVGSEDGVTCLPGDGDPGGEGEQAIIVHANAAGSPGPSGCYYTLANYPFTTIDGGGIALKMTSPAPAAWATNAQQLEYNSTDGSYLRYTPSNGLMYPDGMRTGGSRDGVNGAQAAVVLSDVHGNHIQCDAGTFPGSQPADPTQTIGYQICTDTIGRQIKFTLDGLGEVTDISWPAADGATEHIAMTYARIEAFLDRSGEPVYDFLLTKVLYPDGSHYDLEYQTFSDLGTVQPSKISFPGGGYVRYEHETGTGTSTGLWTSALKRFVSSDGTSGSEAQYSYTLTTGPGCNPSVPDPDKGRWALSTVINWPSGATETYLNESAFTPYSDYTLKDSNGHVLQSKHSNWETNEAAGNFSFGYVECVPHNLRRTDESVTDDAGNTVLSTYSHDAWNNVTQASILSGTTVLRQSNSTFKDLTQSPNQGYVDANLLHLLTLSTQSGPEGNSSETSYSYDETSWSPGGFHGDLTSTSRRVDALNVITDHTRYEAHGLPWASIDASGTETSTAFDSSGFFPSSVTVGAGTSSALTTQVHYDDGTGFLAWTKSPNDSAASRAGTIYTYDAMGRASRIDTPDGSYATSVLHYTDSYPRAQVIEHHIQDSQTVLTSSTTFDGLSRTLQKVGADNSTIESTYDVLGRVETVTAPHDASRSSTDSRIHSVSDDLGRPILEEHQALTSVGYSTDSSKSWSYAGLVTNETDANGHQRKATKDLLGRLVSVQEPNAAGTGLGQITNYGYDSLGNLTSVVQHGPAVDTVRRFLYDQSSRLINACNPEGLPSGQSCDGSHWSMTYTYYPTGELQTTTNSNGVTVHYTYDLLHRLVSKTYTNAPAGTLSSCYSYYTSGEYVGYRQASWTQAGACAASLPPTGAQSARLFLAFDPMGRVKREQQCVLSQCATSASKFDFHYNFDLAGNITSKDDGIGQATWFNSFDASGRLSAVTASTIWSGPLYPAQLFSAVEYGPGGHLLRWKLAGTSTGSSGMSARRSYDSKGRTIFEEVNPENP